MSIDVSEKLPIKEACEGNGRTILTGVILTTKWDVFFKGDPAGLRIRVRIERYEDDTREDIKPYIFIHSKVSMDTTL